jgi:hypothetical protein
MFAFQYDAEIVARMENMWTFTLTKKGTLATSIIIWKNRMSVHR